MPVENCVLSEEQIARGLAIFKNFADRLRDCKSRGHPNSYVLSYEVFKQRPEAYCVCNDCETTFFRPMTQKERDEYSKLMKTPITV